eukprot:14928212-Alexandrium_andersonii.AAC.1
MVAKGCAARVLRQWMVEDELAARNVYATSLTGTDHFEAGSGHIRGSVLPLPICASSEHSGGPP